MLILNVEECPTITGYYYAGCMTLVASRQCLSLDIEYKVDSIVLTSSHGARIVLFTEIDGSLLKFILCEYSDDKKKQKELFNHCQYK